MKTYNEKEIRKIFNEQAYKYACLRDSDGKVRITYNTEQTKNGAKLKVDEAFKRLVNMPDGLYYFCFLNSKGRNVSPDEFAFMKGNVAIDENNKNLPYQIIQQPLAPVKNESDKVLSYPEVLKLQMELTRKEFELDSTKKELSKANSTISDLEAEIKELESKGLSEGGENSTLKWVENLSTQLLPVFDRFMNYKEKSLEAQKKRVVKKTNNPKQIQLPVIGSPEFDKWLDVLENSTDDEFNKTLEFLKQKSPSHYNAVVEAFSEEEQEEKEEQEQ